MSDAAKVLDINRTTLLGIMVGMGMRAAESGEWRTAPRLLTPAQVRLIARHLAAYRAAHKGGT
jgi:hypothetical protein